MRQKALLAVFALSAVLVIGAPMTFATNLLTNGSFETGSFSGWTTSGNFEFTQVSSGPFYVYSGAEDGQFYVTMGPVGSDGTLSQTFSDVAGHSYTFSFWMASAGDDPSDFSVSWDGASVFSQTDPNTGGAWTLFSFSETATGSDTIQFSFRDDPGYIALDNVSVGPCCSPTPEPDSLLLLCSGLLTVGGVICRKFRAGASTSVRQSDPSGELPLQ